MNITEIRIDKMWREGALRAVVSVTFDGEFALHDVMVIRATDRYLLKMPSRELPDGRFKDVFHPVSEETRIELEEVVLDRYFEAAKKQFPSTGGAARSAGVATYET